MGVSSVAPRDGIVRALLVAVEEYGGDLTPVAGATDDMLALRRWLIEDRGARAEDVIVCAGPACAERTFGNTREELTAALRRLVADGADRTDTLYVYLAGRGFQCPQSPFAHAIDLLAARDLVDLADPGRKSLPLVELQAYLAFALGPGQHLHFVDARRTTLTAESIEPAPLGLAPRRSRRGRADVFALVGASTGRSSAADHHFAGALRAALAAGAAADAATEGAAERFRRLAMRVRARIGEDALEVVCPDPHRPPQIAHALDPPADRATCWSVELGERILRSDGPDPRPPALASVDAARDTTSALYLFAAFADATRAREVSLGPARLGAVEWAPGAAQRWIDLRPGPQTVELTVPGWQPLELATCTLFGHVTLIVLSDDEEGRLDLRQLIVPSPHLVGRMPGPLRYPTRALRFIAEAQRRLARGLPIVDERAAWEQARWDDLVAGRWVDPVLSLVAAYQLLRRGGEADTARVATIVRALRTRHPGLPDTDVIAAAIGIEAYAVSGWPLFLDALMTMEQPPRPAAGALVCDSAWTVFRLPPQPATAPRAASALGSAGS